MLVGRCDSSAPRPLGAVVLLLQFYSNRSVKASPGYEESADSFVLAQRPFLPEHVMIMTGETVGFVADVLQQP